MHGFIYFSLGVIGLSFLSSLRIFMIKPLAAGPGYLKLLRTFAFFLLFILLGESFGVAWPRLIWRHTPFGQGNQWFYTLFHFVTYLFYLWFFAQILDRPGIKKTTQVFLIIYILGSTTNYIFIQGPLQLNTFSDLLVCFMVLFLCIAYYFQLIQARKYVPLNGQPFFWICTGLLVYHLGSMMGLFLINVMDALSEEKALSILFIVQLSAVLMYVNYVIAYLCMKRT